MSETLVAWGVAPLAVTRFCDQPGLPTVGGTKDPDVAAVVDLDPDLVVVNDEENRREDADALAVAGVPVHVVTVRAVEDVPPALDALRHRLGLPPAPAAPLPAPPPVPAPPAVRAFVPIWRRPWMSLAGDTYGSSLLAAAGAANVLADAAERYPVVTLDDVTARRPDVVLAPSEPYPFRARHVEELTGAAPVVELVDGRDLFWWGVRTPAALGRLRRVVARLATPEPS